MSKGGSAAKIKLNSYDDLFGGTEMSAGTEQVQAIPLSDLYEFKGHPFKVLDDEKMQETVESIKNYGVLMPGIARPRAGGGYEIIAGHRRKHGCELAGLSTMPMFIRDYSDDEATIIMVDTNIQREDILPSEKARAYAMKYEAMKHQGKKGNGSSLDEVGEAAGESGKTVQRYIWLARLSDELLDMVDKKKIGLERIRRELGKPDIIYVKNFVISQENDGQPDKAGTDTSAEDGESELQKSEKPTSRSLRSRLQEVGKTDFKDSDNQTSGSRKNGLQEVGESAPNYNNTSYNNQSYTDMSHINPISQYESGESQIGGTDRMEETNAYIELIKENIEYEHHMENDSWNDRALYDELFEVICEVVCVKRSTVRIAGEDYPYELVKSKFLKLNSSHLQYVIGRMHETNTKIGNIKAYMVTALYNAPMTINHFYQQEVQHDMYGGGWQEKGII